MWILALKFFFFKNGLIFNARIKKNIRMLKNVLHIIMVAMATYFPHQIFVKKEKFSNQVHS
jgi:hypothetical protein